MSRFGIVDVIDKYERAYQPELQTVKEKLATYIFRVAGLLSLPIFTGHITVDSVRSPAVIVALILTAGYFGVGGWRIWEYWKYEMSNDWR